MKNKRNVRIVSYVEDIVFQALIRATSDTYNDSNITTSEYIRKLILNDLKKRDILTEIMLMDLL
jgi:hypothetical protein